MLRGAVVKMSCEGCGKHSATTRISVQNGRGFMFCKDCATDFGKAFIPSELRYCHMTDKDFDKSHIPEKYRSIVTRKSNRRSG